MAEGGPVEDERQRWRVRMMYPYPPRPFDAYHGQAVNEGEMIACFQVLKRHTWRSFPYLYALLLRRDIIQRVDCAFVPYSEEWLTVSVDLQIAHAEILRSLNDGPMIFMAQHSVSDEERIDIPYRRSKKSTSTACCSDGNLIAWPGYTQFSVFNRFKGIRTRIPSFFEILCSAFSPCGAYLALLTSNTDLLDLRIVDANTLEIIATGCYLPDFFPDHRPDAATFEDNPIHLMWSKCGAYISMSTYYRELIIFNVTTMIESNSLNSTLKTVPFAGYHQDFYEISHPQAYDFKSYHSMHDKDLKTTFLALGTVDNNIRVFEICDQTVCEQIHETSYPCKYVENYPNLIINCIRYSNDLQILAVAMSKGIIDLVDSVSLLPLKSLPPVTFLVDQPIQMPIFHGFSSLSFACSDKFLAAGATDGMVRVWCIRRPIGPLLALCRVAVRSHCKLEDMSQLPIPPFLLTYLTDTAF